MAGMYFEDLKPGLVIEHAIRRTVTETDNILFSAMTYNCAPLHIDAEYSSQQIYGQRLVNSMFMLALVNGITVIETTIGTTLGNLGFTEIKFPKPVFHGDTIRVRTEILDARQSKSRPDTGIVTFRHVGINQRDEEVCICVRQGLMMLRPKEGAKSGVPVGTKVAAKA
ncbi:MaoC family dehydratase [Ramlibacter sp.]|uniref:MaoC family dehydratase n=1 Tax=Ramlibacter sp. TaxID=1917967 RepID=UPI003D0EAADA